MDDPTAVDVFLKFKSKVSKIGLFLTTDRVYGGPQFIIGLKKYATKIQSTIDKHDSACTQDRCPLTTLDSLEEVEAFVVGFCVASGKKVPL